MEAVAALFKKTRTIFKSHNDLSYRINYYSLFWLFILGSVVGFVLEGLWCIINNGYWESHTATVWGPFCIIYGIGAVVVYLLSALLKNRGILIQFIIFTLSGTVVEYFGSLFQEMLFGTVSWDYSGHFLNLGGRVSLQMAVIWGVLGILFIRVIYPAINKLFYKISGKGWRILCILLSVFMAINLIVTSAAIYRWRARANNIDAGNTITEWIDNTYNDQRMSELFPNMQFVVE